MPGFVLWPQFLGAVGGFKSMQPENEPVARKGRVP
jgi:hypothetical protein